MRLAEGVTARDQRDGFLVVHRHARKSLTDIDRGQERIAEREPRQRQPLRLELQPRRGFLGIVDTVAAEHQQVDAYRQRVRQFDQGLLAEAAKGANRLTVQTTHVDLGVAARAADHLSGEVRDLFAQDDDGRTFRHRARSGQGARGQALHTCMPPLRGVGSSGVGGDTGGSSGPLGSGCCGPRGSGDGDGPVGSGRVGGAGSGGRISGLPMGWLGGTPARDARGG